MNRNKKHQIIIVDDEPDYTFIFQEALKGCNPCPTIKVLHSGIELLEWLETSERPNLIFLDLNMPVATGFDVLRILKSVDKYKVIPVIMLTVTADRVDILDAYQHGASAFITKPMAFPELVHRMQLFSQYWFDIAHTPDRSWSNPDNFTSN